MNISKTPGLHQLISTLRPGCYHHIRRQSRQEGELNVEHVGCQVILSLYLPCFFFFFCSFSLCMKPCKCCDNYLWQGAVGSWWAAAGDWTRPLITAAWVLAGLWEQKQQKKKTRRNTRKLLIEGHHILIKGIRTIYDGEGLFRIFYKEAGFLKMVQTGSYANNFSFFFWDNWSSWKSEFTADDAVNCGSRTVDSSAVLSPSEDSCSSSGSRLNRKNVNNKTTYDRILFCTHFAL